MRTRNTLNLDTTHNLFLLGAPLHQLYVDGKWVLVPKKPLCFITSRRSELSDVQGETLSYRFPALPGPDMQDVFITRQSTDHKRSLFTIKYPFDDFPPITSHVHPNTWFCIRETTSQRSIPTLMIRSCGGYGHWELRMVPWPPMSTVQLLPNTPLRPKNCQHQGEHQNAERDKQMTMVILPNQKKRRVLTSSALQMQKESDDLDIFEWTSDRILNCARTCQSHSSSSVPVIVPVPVSASVCISTSLLLPTAPAKPVLRGPECLKAKLRKV
ncbi:hypothetical protein BJ165DRAFT_1532239 [Panaeolus papilionaceus]|nr:hypothetical protein BJ165DRAFT_1532239 [Panaeolus papilionaceus]